MRIISCFLGIWLLLAPPGWAQSRVGPRPLDQDQLARLKKLPLNEAARERLIIDLTVLLSCYPGDVTGLEVRPDGKIFLTMGHNKAVLPYDDGRSKSFEERLAHPDLEDMLAQTYTPGPPATMPQPNHDPGRFRVTAFFDAVYGSSAPEVQSHLAPVKVAGGQASFNSRNGAARALAQVGERLKELLQKRPELRAYVLPLGGTFASRHIAGTERKSPHAWGIAIDLNPKNGSYWRWGRGVTAAYLLSLQQTYPYALVRLFEECGFIWGGKWWHYDTLHFEYRPELLMKAELLKKAGLKEK